MSTRKSVGEIRDPIYGYIFMTEVERALIDTRPVQRLRRIKQLSGAHLTYPGAEHSRFSHSLGVMHLAGMVGNHFAEMDYIDDRDVQRVRIAGLLHDVGHGPFSHMYEEVLDRYRNMTHEDVTQWLIVESEISDVLRQFGYSPQEISKLSVGRLESKEKRFLDQIIASQFDIDVMDYLVRDSHFTGVEYGNVDVIRLINSLDVINDTLAVNINTLYALEALVIARYEMFKAVYFHRTVRAAEIMIVRAMDSANDDLELTSFKKPVDFLLLDDSSVLLRLLCIRDLEKRNLKIAHELAEMYTDRKLFKCVHETIVHHRSGFFTSVMSRDEIRRQIASEISEKADVALEYVIIDVPTVPSVPYYPLQGVPSDIPVFQKLHNGVKELHSLSEYSPLVSALIGYVDVVRVYTAPRFREKVRKAAYEAFSKQPYSTKITM
jgi:HD superfamily phosphohydrolase